ncbi:MAG: 50S ribosome-binding GTPase, partial [Xanthomonadaceae bacterium]|nr:50S ribosome-binding GTPase [Xanthomonadaceae bacterium]
MPSRPTKPLDLAIVGHTNVGKTSLMRTLMRDVAFGAVAPTSATTRQVEGARLLAQSRPVVELYDTPGLEDASALIERLEEHGGDRHTGPERIAAFIADASDGFEQEARVLAQMLASDAALYVIDAREPVLGKYQDELAILALCARPILPVLNFVAS